MKRISAYMALSCVILGPQLIQATAEQPHRIAPPPLTGKLSQVEGLPVLELWGAPQQRGFTHGYLRAAEIVRIFDEYVFSPDVIPSLEVYNQKLRPAAEQQFEWPTEFELELTGLVAGANRRLSELKVQSSKLKRPFDITDFKVANTLADWRGSACSTISVWGPYTQDGRTLTARNLDYFSTPAMQLSQQAVIQHSADGKHSWLSVCWPGAIGIYTAMSDVGVTMLMHDAKGLPQRKDLRCVPRSIALRIALERASARTMFEDVTQVFRNTRTFIGNNIHVSRPFNNTQPAAGVFEYDGNTKDNGVSVRLATKVYPNALWCTNHMRLRQLPVACHRYAALTKAINEMRADEIKLTPETMFDLINIARVERTLHTVCFDTQTLTSWVYIPEISPQPIRISLRDYLPETSSAAAAE